MPGAPASLGLWQFNELLFAALTADLTILVLQRKRLKPRTQGRAQPKDGRES